MHTRVLADREMQCQALSCAGVGSERDRDREEPQLPLDPPPLAVERAPEPEMSEGLREMMTPGLQGYLCV